MEEQIGKERRELSHVWKQVESEAKKAAQKEERIEAMVGRMLEKEKGGIREEEKKLRELVQEVKTRERAAKEAEADSRRTADTMEVLQRTLDRKEKQLEKREKEIEAKKEELEKAVKVQREERGAEDRGEEQAAEDVDQREHDLFAVDIGERLPERRGEEDPVPERGPRVVRDCEGDGDRRENRDRLGPPQHAAAHQEAPHQRDEHEPGIRERRQPEDRERRVDALVGDEVEVHVAEGHDRHGDDD